MQANEQISITKTEVVNRASAGSLRKLLSRAAHSTENPRAFTSILIAPVIIFFIIWNLVPILWMVGLSFYKYSLMIGTVEYVGVDNFADIIGDGRVWAAMSLSFIWVVLSVSFETILGGLLGFWFWGSQKMPGRRFALSMLFTPMILTPVAAGAFFRLIYEPTFGVANWFTKSLFGTELGFLTDRTLAFGSVMFVDVWMWTPFMILITLAALGSVPKAELEAAEIDRLSFFNRLRYVIIPNGRFILMLGILLRTIDSFKTLDLVYLMTQGGPGRATDLIALHLRRQAFEALDFGWSSALAIVMLLTAIAFTSIYLYILNQNTKKKGELSS
jgi:multiple sugar transport system permease protein